MAHLDEDDRAARIFVHPDNYSLTHFSGFNPDACGIYHGICTTLPNFIVLDEADSVGVAVYLQPYSPITYLEEQRDVMKIGRVDAGW
jgi:hypothetical protein